MTFYVISVIICILLSAFFSSSEMSLSSANKMRLENLADDGSKRAALACRIIDNFDSALSSILIGNNFANIAISSVATVIAVIIANKTGKSEDALTFISTVIVTAAVIVFGETIPKIVAKKNANRLALVVCYPIRLLTIILWPLIFIVVSVVKLITLPMKGEEDEADEDAAALELQSIIEMAEDEDVLDEERSELLQAALDFDETAVYEVMTARVDVYAVDISDEWDDVYKAILASPFSRIPVYDGSIDNIVGILFLNRFFKALLDNEKPDIRSLLMPPEYIYKTTKLPDVLSRLKTIKCHLAVVTDEYGGCTGIVSLEDVLEEIVGEIWDENDVIEDEVVEAADGTYELDGDMAISDFIELMELNEDEFEGESSTLGGFCIEIAGTYPEKGSVHVYDNIALTVLETDGLRVIKVKAEKLRSPEDEEN